MAAATEGTLDNISKQLASSPGGAWLEKISKQLDSRGASGNDPFMGFKVPALTDVAKGLFFGLAPGLVKKSVSGMQTFVDALNNITIPDADASLKIAKVIDEFSDAIITFGNISWSKAFKGTFLIESFANRFVKIGEILGSPENLTRLQPFRRFARTFAEPLKNIGEALSYFDKIQWVKMFFGTKIFEKLIFTFVKMGKLAVRNKDSIKTLGSVLKNLSKPIGDFFESFGKLKFVKLLLGSKIFEKIILSLINPANLISQNKQIFERFGKTLNNFSEPLTKFVTAFNNMKFVKMFIGVKVLEKIIDPLVHVAKTVSKNKQIFERFGTTLSSITDPLRLFGETFDKIGNALLKASVSLLIVAGSLALSAYSFKLFADIPFGAVVAGFGALIGMSTSLLILSKVSGQIIKAAAALGVVAGTLGLAALSFKMFADVDMAKVAGSVGLLTVIMGGLVAMGAALTGPQLGFVAIAAGIMALVGAAVIPFAYGLQKLSEINWKGFDGIFTALGKLAAGVALLTFGVPGMLLATVAAIPFAIGMALLSEVKWDLIQKSGDALMSLANGVAQLNISTLIKTGLAMIPFAAGVVALRLAVGNDDKISKFLEKFNKGLKDLKGESLTLASKGILALSGALVAFSGLKVVSGIGNLIGKILSFGADSPIQQLIKLAKHGYNLSILGTGVKDLSAGLKTLTGIDNELNILDNLADKLKGFETLDPTGIKAFSEGLNMLVTSLTALSQLDGKLNVLNNIPYDKLKSLSESIKTELPLTQIVNGLKESSESKQVAELLKQGIATNAPTVGSQLRESGASMNSSMIIVNNNGGNITNNSSTSSNVNNNGSSNTPIITASGSGMFTAE